MRLPTIIGEDAPRPGSDTFQARFFSLDHDTGADFSLLIPRPSTPRQQAQSAAETAREQHNNDKATAWKERDGFMGEAATLLDADSSLNLSVQHLDAQPQSRPRSRRDGPNTASGLTGALQVTTASASTCSTNHRS